MPDSAIDLLDEASSALRLSRESKPEDLETLDRNITTLKIELSSLGKDNDTVSIERRDSIKEELTKLEAQAEEMKNVWNESRRKNEEVKANREKLEKARFELESSQRFVILYDRCTPSSLIRDDWPERAISIEHLNFDLVSFLSF